MTYVPTAWVDGDCVMAADMNHIEHGVDIAQGDIMVPRGVTAAIPASDPELVGRLYIETDLLQRMWRDNGAGWDLVPTGGGVWAFIAETILGAPAATVTFAAIPGTYRALKLFYLLRGDGIADQDYVQVLCNADAGANYSFEWGGSTGAFVGISAAAQTSIQVGQLTDGNSADANIFSIGELTFYNYTSISFYKEVLGLTWGARDYDVSTNRWQVQFGWGMWLNAGTAITSLTIFPAISANFITGSRIALYGIT